MDYAGLPTQSIESPFLRLDYLTTLGPRLVRLVPAGSALNLLAETPEVNWQTPFGVYHVRGGHRLWAAPQDEVRTAIPDNDPILVEELPDGVRLSQPAEAPTGLAKTIEVHLDPHSPALALHHTITNRGAWTIELAPWAITQLPLGGRHIVPLADPRPGILSCQPNRMVTLWPYAHWDDPRLKITQEYIQVRAEAGAEFKLGTLNHQGWAAYLWGDYLLCKRFSPSRQAYPDLGSNTEVYLFNKFTELETLGPLAHLAPGESVTHVEQWTIYHRTNLPDFIPAWLVE